MRTILAFGTNLGDRSSNLRRAISALYEIIPNIKFVSLYESAALLKEGSPKEWNQPFLNTVAYGETSLTPLELLHFCQSIENAMGRDPNHPVWSPRIIDIDILFYENTTMITPTLTLPHPETLNRLFVMLPLAEIDESFINPLWNQHFQKSPKEIITELSNVSTKEEIPTKIMASSND